jgi:hypothetical protein
METFETIWDEFNLECPWWVGVQWVIFIMLKPIVWKAIEYWIKIVKENSTKSKQIFLGK